MRQLTRAGTCAVAFAVGLGVLFLQAGTTAQNSSAPRYKFDPDFPRPLPNKWKIGGVMGISIMADDSIWVYNRPNDLTNLELGAETTPPDSKGFAYLGQDTVRKYDVKTGRMVAEVPRDDPRELRHHGRPGRPVLPPAYGGGRFARLYIYG